MAKHKHKTHKGLSKRVKLTASGKLKRKSSGAGHLMSGKSGDRCRRLKRKGLIGKTDARRVRIALGPKA